MTDENQLIIKEKSKVGSIAISHLIGHSIFVLLNILIVLMNVLIPRIINKEELEIVHVDYLIDEQEAYFEHLIDTRITNILRTAFHQTPKTFLNAVPKTDSDNDKHVQQQV